jgi:hypothetical protein
MLDPGDMPSILGDLRTGAAFVVREMLGPEGLLERELRLARRAVARLAQHPRIHVLGPEAAPRLAIVSLTIDNLHHDFASLLLDHLFGIQSRAGYSGGGNLGDVLLGLDRATSARYKHLVRRGIESMRPGWLRLSLPCYVNDEDVEFVLSAVEFVAQHGEAFLPLYRLSWRDGMWRHIEGPGPVPPGLELTREALEQVAALPFAAVPEPPLPEHELRAERKRYFDQARDLAVRLAARWRAMPPLWNRPTADPEVDALVWFRYAQTDGHPE